MNEAQKFVAEIETPSKEFSPIPFWFFNDMPDEEKIKAQLADYVEKGVNGIVLHPRIGVPREVPYLSEAYFQAVRFIVQTADRLGMKVVLYDEGMYPSGSAHGMVVAQNPDYASKGISLTTEPKARQVIAALQDGNYLVYGFTNGTIRGIHFGEDDLEAEAPKSADILNPDAVELFIRLTHDRYYEELKEYFGNTVIAFFTDEPCALGRNAAGFKEWVPGMEEEITAEGGCLEELADLFIGKQNHTTEIYHRLIKKHLRETFYARLSHWCEDHGISLMGHPEVSDDVEEEWFFHIPGQDLIMRRVSPESGGIREFDSVQAKLPADIARHLGRRRNANECFGVCNHGNIPWYFKGYDMKWYINWLGIRGVNFFVPHAFYYSIEGKRKEERPPDVGPNNIWWPHYRMVSDYIKRISWLMTDTTSFARVAVLCANNRVPYKEVAELYEHQVDFHYLPIDMLSLCRVVENRLCVRDCAFDVVLDVYGEWENVSAAYDFADVRVVRRGAELWRRRNKRGDEACEIPECGFSGCGIPDCEIPDCRTIWAVPACESLRAVHHKKDGVEWYLLSNEGNVELDTRVTLPALQAENERRVLLCVDLWRGEVRECVLSEDGAVLVGLQPCEMLLFLLADRGEAEEILRERRIENRAPAIDLGDWTGRFTLSKTEENRLVYIYHYQADQITGGEYFTVTGEEMAECDCNGQFAGASLYGPHTFQIGSFLQSGDNEIRVSFTGNAVNLFGPVNIPFGLGVTSELTLPVNANM
ncbi:MAG: hypothetical protein NC417_13185 [Candidatus Gastranaerophilales bacterium]|nr:hypothetical protein [Candidatus Gastranaerophilales bacterium]